MSNATALRVASVARPVAEGSAFARERASNGCTRMSAKTPNDRSPPDGHGRLEQSQDAGASRRLRHGEKRPRDRTSDTPGGADPMARPRSLPSQRDGLFEGANSDKLCEPPQVIGVFRRMRDGLLRRVFSFVLVRTSIEHGYGVWAAWNRRTVTMEMSEP
jgi:hypothetical protein